MSERFLAGGWRIAMAWLLVFAMPAMGIYTLVRPPDAGAAIGALSLATGLLFLILGGVFAWGLLHRSRPVIEISDELLEFGSIYGFGSRKRIPLGEIERVDLAGPRLDLTLRGGRLVRLRLPEVAPETRRAARDAIERRLART